MLWARGENVQHGRNQLYLISKVNWI